MAKKHNADLERLRPQRDAPDLVLAFVVSELQADVPIRHERACLYLLQHGPLFADDTWFRAHGQPWVDGPGELTPTLASDLRTELLEFLRAILNRQGPGPWSGGIATAHPFQFWAEVLEDQQPEQSTPFYVRGSVRDVIVLQLVLLIRQVGRAMIRICRAPDCDRLYVKRFRREFCSVTCQSRTFMRTRRENDRRKQSRRRHTQKRRTPRR